jgi:hypothetical protein
MLPEYDRIKCVICGHSAWKDFNMRRPATTDLRVNPGPPTGMRENYGKNIRYGKRREL